MAIWQKHWSNTASDPRMQWLLTEMGARGYGIYWLISERLTACEQGALLQQQLVRDMRSRQLNGNYILQVINNYFLFETDEGGYVRHHRVWIGHMNAHTLHLLRTGQLLPADLGSTMKAKPSHGVSGGATGAKSAYGVSAYHSGTLSAHGISGGATNARPTLSQRPANATPVDTIYNVRAHENRRSISFLKNEIQDMRARENKKDVSFSLNETKGAPAHGGISFSSNEAKEAPAHGDISFSLNEALVVGVSENKDVEADKGSIMQEPWLEL